MYEEKTAERFMAVMPFKKGFLAGGSSAVYYYEVND
jgi:hypothetical protein